MVRLADTRRTLLAKARRFERVTARAWQDELDRTSPYATGELRESQSVSGRTSASRVTVTAEATAEHATYVQSGTRPRVIRARRASALRFYWPKAGGVVYFRQVQHPGTAPNPWFSRAADTIRRKAQTLWSQS